MPKRTHGISVEADDVARLVRSVLRLRPSEALGICVVDGFHRNLTFALTGAVNAYIKLPRSDNPTASFEREAVALEHVKGCLTAPLCLAYGERSEVWPAFLVTSACAGMPLDQFVPKLTSDQASCIFRQIARTLRAMNDVPPLRAALKRLETRLVGVYQPDFCPVSWLRRQDILLDLVGGLAPSQESETCILHGSLSCNNIMIEAQGRQDCRLSALLDFEGARRGPKGMDQAMFWYDLMLESHTGAAELWIDEISKSPVEDGIQAGFIASAAWLAAFRTMHEHPQRPLDWDRSPHIHQALRDIRDRWAI